MIECQWAKGRAGSAQRLSLPKPVSRAAAQAADALAVGMSWELGSASTMHYLSAQAVSTGREHYLSAPERYRLASDHR